MLPLFWTKISKPVLVPVRKLNTNKIQIKYVNKCVKTIGKKQISFIKIRVLTRTALF